MRSNCANPAASVIPAPVRAAFCSASKSSMLRTLAGAASCARSIASMDCGAGWAGAAGSAGTTAAGVGRGPCWRRFCSSAKALRSAIGAGGAAGAIRASICWGVIRSVGREVGAAGRIGAAIGACTTAAGGDETRLLKNSLSRRPRSADFSAGLRASNACSSSRICTCAGSLRSCSLNASSARFLRSSASRFSRYSLSMRVSYLGFTSLPVSPLKATMPPPAKSNSTGTLASPPLAAIMVASGWSTGCGVFSEVGIGPRGWTIC